MKFNLIQLSAALFLSASLVSCSKDDDGPSIKPYTVPDTYNFDNVEYSESAARISMWAGYTGILGKGSSRLLSQDTINYLWNNTNNAFTAETAGNVPYNQDALNALAFNLSGKTADAQVFKVLADSMVKISQYYNTPASRGVVGKYGSRVYNYTGLEFNQAIAKGMMGSLALYNINAILDKIKTDDNTSPVNGSGTAMEHNWDLAFGYVGIPKDYDTAFAYTSAIVDRPLAIGGYFGERGKYIQAGGKVFEAFRKGRAAITAKDYGTRDAAIATIKEYLEKTIAAAGYYYVTSSQTQADLGAKFHSLSEGFGFMLALKYRAANSPLSEANFLKLVDILKTDFYVLADDASNTKLKEAQAILTTSYGQLQP